jgi:hypothetical protein
MHTLKRLASAVGLTLTAVAITAVAASASNGTPTVPPQPIADSQLPTSTATSGGAPVYATTRTIPYWFGSTLNPVDGITYGYNIAGADPNTCSGQACDVTVQVDIKPIVLRIDGMTFSAADVIPALLASPLFAENDYGSTPFATGGDSFDLAPRGPGGLLSQGDAGNLLQLQDATMRAQFGRVGSSPYHLRLHPNVEPAVTADVPPSQGILLRSGRGVVFAGVDYQWFRGLVSRVMAASDPTHFALMLSDDTIPYVGTTKNFTLAILGVHGATTPIGIGSGNSAIQTWAWATWLSPGLYARPDGGNYWVLQDMDVLSHEISEWADDPFATNYVPAWPYYPGNLQFCNTLLETGDPVNDAGFAMGANTYRQGPNPNGTQSADGYYHPEDEATLPWFKGLEPNLISEPMQTPSPHIGRYTFMGDLNTFVAFQHPATRCPAGVGSPG